jgi:hypothetical protein
MHPRTAWLASSVNMHTQQMKAYLYAAGKKSLYHCMVLRNNYADFRFVCGRLFVGAY